MRPASFLERPRRKAHARHQAARVHHTCRRRGGMVAARTGAAAGADQAARHSAPNRPHKFLQAFPARFRHVPRGGRCRHSIFRREIRSASCTIETSTFSTRSAARHHFSSERKHVWRQSNGAFLPRAVSCCGTLFSLTEPRFFKDHANFFGRHSGAIVRCALSFLVEAIGK